MGEGGGGKEKGRFLSFSSLPFSLPSFLFSPETPDTQATALQNLYPAERIVPDKSFLTCQQGFRRDKATQ